MAAYIGIYFILILTSLTIKDRNSLIAFLLIGLFLIIFMGLRHEVGCDYGAYNFRFSYSHAFVLDTLPFISNEWGFSLLTYMMQELTGSFEAFLTLISAILVICYVTFARAFHGSLTILALLFPIIIVQLGMSGVRQALAGGFLMLSAVSFVKGHRWLVAAWILVGFQFHTSIIVFLPIALLAGRNISMVRLLGVLIVVTPVVALLIGDRLDLYSDRYIEQVYGTQDAKGGIIRYGLVMISVIMFAFYSHFIRRDFPEVFPLLKLFAWISASLIILLPLSTVALHRFSFYVMPLSILTFHYLAISAVVRNQRLAAQSVPIILYGLYSISWLALSGHAAKCYLPYQNWLFIF